MQFINKLLQTNKQETQANMAAVMQRPANGVLNQLSMQIKAAALQQAIFYSANFSSIATDANGVIQIFNVGAERMLGYTAAEVINTITPADISDPQEIIARALSLSAELNTQIAPGFEAMVFKASRGIEDIYELTYIRKDGSRFPAVVSVTALRNVDKEIIGYLLIGTDNTARKQAEEALMKAGALQKAIFNSANFSSIATDANGVIQIFNVGAERMLGYSAAEVVNTITPADISDPHEIIARAKTLSLELNTQIEPGFEALVFKASRGIEDIYELTYIRKDGTRFPAVVSVTALRNAEDEIIGFLLIGTDNTARVSEKNKLLLSDAALKAIAEGVVITDSQGLTIYANNAFLTTTGYTLDELLGRNLSLLQGRLTDTRDIAQVRKSIEIGSYYSGDILNYKKDGTIFWQHMTISPILSDEKSKNNYIGITQDITQRKNSDEENKTFAYLDPLTNLPNRRLLHDRLQQLIAGNKRTNNYSAMIVIDFDNFKELNDSYGHETGDLFLIEASHRVMSCVRESDTVARLGGDEFIVLLSNLNKDKDLAYLEAMKVAEKIRALIAITFGIPGEKDKYKQGMTSLPYGCTASLGMVLFTCPSISANSIIKFADSAMYKAKKSGKNSISFTESSELEPIKRQEQISHPQPSGQHKQ